MLKLAVTGAAGRMGQRIVALARESGEFEVVCALESKGHELLGRDVGVVAGLGEIGVALNETVIGKPEVMIDFSLPIGTEKWGQYCGANKVPLVVGTAMNLAFRCQFNLVLTLTAVVISAGTISGFSQITHAALAVSKTEPPPKPITSWGANSLSTWQAS